MNSDTCALNGVAIVPAIIALSMNKCVCVCYYSAERLSSKR